MGGGIYVYPALIGLVGHEANNNFFIHTVGGSLSFLQVWITRVQLNPISHTHR